MIKKTIVVGILLYLAATVVYFAWPSGIYVLPVDGWVKVNNGECSMVGDNEKPCIFEWNGDCLDGKAQGRGKVKFKCKSSEGTYAGTELYYLNRGLPEGTSTGYRDNGELWYTIEFHNGKMHGTRKNYYPNGKLWFECEYRDGLLHGTCRYFNAAGELESVEEFRDGESAGGKKTDYAKDYAKGPT